MHGCLPFPAKLYHYLAFALTPLCDGQTVCGVRALIHNIGVQPIPRKLIVRLRADEVSLSACSES